MPCIGQEMPAGMPQHVRMSVGQDHLTSAPDADVRPIRIPELALKIAFLPRNHAHIDYPQEGHHRHDRHRLGSACWPNHIALTGGGLLQVAVVRCGYRLTICTSKFPNAGLGFPWIVKRLVTKSVGNFLQNQ